MNPALDELKFDKNGRFIKSSGTRGNQPGQLNLPHSLQVDLQGNVYIGDRSNARVQVFQRIRAEPPVAQQADPGSDPQRRRRRQ